jgi:hypothetical protein
MNLGTCGCGHTLNHAGDYFVLRRFRADGTLTRQRGICGSCWNWLTGPTPTQPEDGIERRP